MSLAALSGLTWAMPAPNGVLMTVGCAGIAQVGRRADDRAARNRSGWGPRSGDGFLQCDDGHMRWGRYGAAGALYVVRGDTHIEAMVQLRSPRAHEGGTWSCPGGAMDRGEDPLAAALRETTEEVGAPPEPFELLGNHVFAPAGDWRYVTAVIAVPFRFGVAANFETTEVRWCSGEQIERLPLHPGFAAAWPHLWKIALG